MLDQNTKILVIMPAHVNIIGSFEKNLKKYCPNSLVTSLEENFKYPHFGHKIYNAFRKIFFKDTSYKQKLLALHIKKRSENIKKNVEGNFDYILVIRPDDYNFDMINTFKPYVSKKMVAYQWDGLERFQEIFAYIKSGIFDDFFVFEPKDLEKYPNDNLKFITNFYFDFKENNQAPVEHKPTEYANTRIAYFVGGHYEERYDEVIKLAQQLQKNNIKLDFNIAYNKANKFKLYEQYSIQCFKGFLSHVDNLDHVANADILVDLCMKDVHTGLSFRIFEALYAQKKLITNNPAVKDYEFYHPNNIFIMENDNLHDLEKFLALPMVQLDEDMIAKYSFYNWLKNILDIEPYQRIPMPKG